MNDIENLKEEMKKKLTKNEIKKLNKLNLFYRIFDENFTLNNATNIINLMYHGKYNVTKFNIKNHLNYYIRTKPIKTVMKMIYINEQKLRNIIFEYIWKKIDYDFSNNIKTLNDYKLIFNIFLVPYHLCEYSKSYTSTRIYESLEDEFIEASLKINFKEEFLNRFLFIRTMYIVNSNTSKYMYLYTIPFNKKILGFPAKEIKDYLYERKLINYLEEKRK